MALRSIKVNATPSCTFLNLLNIQNIILISCYYVEKLRCLMKRILLIVFIIFLAGCSQEVELEVSSEESPDNY